LNVQVTPPIAAAADILLAPPPLATAGRRAADADNKYPARRCRLRKTCAYYYNEGDFSNADTFYASSGVHDETVKDLISSRKVLSVVCL